MATRFTAPPGCSAGHFLPLERRSAIKDPPWLKQALRDTAGSGCSSLAPSSSSSDGSMMVQVWSTETALSLGPCWFLVAPEGPPNPSPPAPSRSPERSLQKRSPRQPPPHNGGQNILNPTLNPWTQCILASRYPEQVRILMGVTRGWAPSGFFLRPFGKLDTSLHQWRYWNPQIGLQL